MDNIAIADQFTLLSKLMTFHEENPFKIRSYSNAAYQIERLPHALSEMTLEEIGKVPGIGSAIQKKIEVLLQTGHFPLLEKYIDNTPKGIRDMLDIKGIGSKKLAIIWKQMDIETAGELLYACNEDRLTRYKGFGAKTQENIRKAIAYYLQSLGSFLYAEALEFSNQILSILKEYFDMKTIFLPTGNLRRKCNTLEALEFVTNAPLDEIPKHLPKDFRSKSENENKIILEKEAFPKVIFYYAEQKKIGSVLFKNTGNADFIQSFYEKYPQIENTDFESEDALFKTAGISPIQPPLREYKIENIPVHENIIQPKHIKGIIHSHSTWSDGRNSIKQMAVAAKSMGMEYIVISDHSKSAGYAKGLSRERVLAQQEEINKLNKELAPFKIFKSIESDILSDGALDYDSDILDTFDLVIASVHSNLRMDKQKATERLLTAISNPYTTILGHPTGRLLLSREGYPIDHKKIIDACVANNVVIEINAHPRRLDLDWHYIANALQQGATLSIDPDAHSLKGLEDIKYGVWSAQKGGLTPKKNLSSFSLEALEDFLSKQK